MNRVAIRGMGLEAFLGRLLERLLEPDVSEELHGRLLKWISATAGEATFTRAAAIAQRLHEEQEGDSNHG